MERAGRRVAIGVAVAAVLAVGLHFALGRFGAPAAASPEADPAAAPPDELARLPSDLPHGAPWLIYLTHPAATRRPPPAARPAVAILPGGRVVVRRGAPAPLQPGVDGSDWLAAAIELPRRRLSELEAPERAALLELLRAWGVDRDHPDTPLVRAGRPGEVPGAARLRRWLR